MLAASCGSLTENRELSLDGPSQATDGVAGKSKIAGSIFRATAVATVRQPVTTVRTGLAVLWNRPQALLTGNVPVSLPLTEPSPSPPGSEGFERELDRMGMRPREVGTMRWLLDGKEFFPALDRHLGAAENSVDLQVFIFDNDDIAVRYADRLRDLSGRRRVRVLYDDIGSAVAQTVAPETPAPEGFVAPSDMRAYLREGSEVSARRVLNPWFVCDHTKLIVTDHRRALLGGMNIGREYYSEWHDLMIEVEGPVVSSLALEFSRAWRKAGPAGDFALLRAPAFVRRPVPSGGGVPVRLLRTDPAVGKYEVYDATLLAARSARERIWVENPYFASDEIALELANAARRGVDVRVILPSRGDSTIMDHGNMATARDLMAAGAKVYRYPKMTHMKVMICDGWAHAGSANLDTLSLRINRELNLATNDSTAVRDLERRVFLPDFRVSRRVRMSETESLIAPIAEAVADQL
ncbi:MAG: phosphatidylserine/phosphatidylglycerophosphate/cardiolipin synthase family protein [Akkermansiaceae bacterium]|nr:phosphatidylserine/phosphatidylglycerophosphate/cardiolipin synthase family protein [Akkermansiaceae bacterium]